MRHPLEKKFNASASEILSAIERGFRAQVDVKGKLAEYFLHREIERLKSTGIVQHCDWQDKDGEPDFLVDYRNYTLRVECKNVRSGQLFRNPPAYKVEIQKTRNAIGGGPTRGYRVDEFDVLAACLFNHTGKWSYLYAATRFLRRREAEPKFLMIFQPVPQVVTHPWHDSLVGAMDEALLPRKK